MRLYCLRHWNKLLSLAVLTVVLAACTSGGLRPAAKSATTATAGPNFSRSTRPYTLYTHCGIDEARIGSRYFAAAHPLSDGADNPPAGWGNPFQKGTMTLLSPSTAVFRDHAGHRVLFVLRRGARSFKRVCA